MQNCCSCSAVVLHCLQADASSECPHAGLDDSSASLLSSCLYMVRSCALSCCSAASCRPSEDHCATCIVRVGTETAVKQRARHSCGMQRRPRCSLYTSDARVRLTAGTCSKQEFGWRRRACLVEQDGCGSGAHKKPGSGAEAASRGPEPTHETSRHTTQSRRSLACLLGISE